MNKIKYYNIYSYLNIMYVFLIKIKYYKIFNYICLLFFIIIFIFI